MGKNASKTKELSHPKRQTPETDKMDETDDMTPNPVDTDSSP